MKRYWELACGRIEGMSLRERIVIFLAAAFVIYALLDVVLLAPLLAKKNALLLQVTQQQAKLKELQGLLLTQIQAMQDDRNSPLRTRVAMLRQQLQEQEAYLQSRRDRLVEPDKMAVLLEQVLNKNTRLRLVKLETLPASPLVEKHQEALAADSQAMQKQPDKQKQFFKHGLQITVRGGYLDMLQYLVMLEKLPVQMFWGDVSLSVEKYPDSVLTLTLYTLSREQIWLTV